MTSGIGSIGNAQTLAGTQSTQARPPPPPKGERPSHQDAIEHLGSSLSAEAKAELLADVETMLSEGATDDEVRDYVNQTLQDAGISLPHLEERGALFDQTA